MYTLILALAILAIYALRRALRAADARGHAIWWATLVAATSIAFYSHILAALLIPIEIILTIIWGWGSRDRYRWAGALASFAFLTLPYVPLLRWQLPMAFTRAETGYIFYPLDQMLQIMTNGFITGISGILPLITVWPAVILLLVGLVCGAMRWRDKAALVIWLLVPPVGIWLVSLNRPIFTDRYLIWISPAFYLLMAAGAAAIWRFWRPLGIAAVITIVGIASAGTYYQTATPIKSDFRGVAHYLEARHLPGDLVIFQIPYVRYTFDYYYSRPYEWADGLFTNYGMSDAEVDAQMRIIVAGRKTIWLVASEMTMWDSKLQVWHWLESHAQRLESVVFAQVTLYKYRLDEQPR